MVFFLGFLMIFFGIFLAKKFKVIGDLFMSNEDRKLLEKAKRTLGLGSSSPSPNSRTEPAPYSSSSNDMHPFGHSDVHPATSDDMQFDNNHEPSRRSPGEGYPSIKVKKNEPVSVGGPESAENLKDSLLGSGQQEQPLTSFSTKKWVDPLKTSSAGQQMASAAGPSTFQPLQYEEEKI